MPTIPKIVTLTNSSVDILNAIRNDATQNYKDYVPTATADAESIKAIGTIIMDNPQLQNTFLNTLVNRIGRVMVTSKMYSNPLKSFKKGLLEFGETIEEIFVNIAKPYQYDPSGAESTQYKREIPDVTAM
jgi:phage-related minor tail protein